MKLLAFLYTTLSSEASKTSSKLRGFKRTNLKALSSIAMGFITSGVAVSALTYSGNAQGNLYYRNKGSDVVKLQAALDNIVTDGVFGYETLARLKSYQAKHGLVVDGIAGSATLSSLGLPDSPRNLTAQSVGVRQEQSRLEQYGRLRLINDTPYMGIVSLYKPGEKKPCRYAYIPPYAERTLLDTYSSRWQVSFNKHGEFLIAEKNAGKEDDTFKIKLSSLNREEQKLSEYKSSKDLTLEPVKINYFAIGEFLPLVKTFVTGKLSKPQFMEELNSWVKPGISEVESLLQTAMELNNPEAVMNAVEEHSKLWNTAMEAVISDNFDVSDEYTRILREKLEQELAQREVDIDEVDIDEVDIDDDDFSQFHKEFKLSWNELLKDCPQLFTHTKPEPFTNANNDQPVSELGIEAFKQLLRKKKDLENFATPSINQSAPRVSPISNWTVASILQKCKGSTALSKGPILVNSSTQFQKMPKKCILMRL
jgi:hypothetical protein